MYVGYGLELNLGSSLHPFNYFLSATFYPVTCINMLMHTAQTINSKIQSSMSLQVYSRIEEGCCSFRTCNRCRCLSARTGPPSATSFDSIPGRDQWRRREHSTESPDHSPNCPPNTKGCKSDRRLGGKSFI